MDMKDDIELANPEDLFDTVFALVPLFLGLMLIQVLPYLEIFTQYGLQSYYIAMIICGCYCLMRGISGINNPLWKSLKTIGEIPHIKYRIIKIKERYKK